MLFLKVVVEVFNTISVIVGVVLLITFENLSHDKLWLCCTVQGKCRCVLGATAVYKIAQGCLRSGKLCILYNVELRVCPVQKTAQQCLMLSLIPAMQEMSTIALLHGSSS